MKLLINALLIFVLFNVSGCAFLKAFKQSRYDDANSEHPWLQTFKFEGTLIHYRDLSDPCDDTTVAWNDSSQTLPIQKVSHKVGSLNCEEKPNDTRRVTATQFEVEHELSISFESSKTELLESNNAKSIAGINDLVAANSQFHIYGAAGTVGKRSEALGLERASVVRDYLVDMGIRHERITIMPYDPQIPGLQAVVRVLKPVML